MTDKNQGIVILGSTGSIGKSTLQVIEQNPERFNVKGLSCLSNVGALAEQVKKFKPVAVATGEGKADELIELLGDDAEGLRIWEGREGYSELAALESASKLVAAMVGAAGIEPVLSGIRSGKTIALANKESLVLAGSLLLKEAKKHDVSILPIDSEHNAVFQSLYGEKKKHLAFITLTASGGPFRTRPLESFDSITLQEALQHPNWNMGKKITVDSATMMNKCLEIIEAKWLFDIEPDKIKVLIHPQSIVHSMVTFKDASTICQMGTPDMKIPIANCLGFPSRIKSGSEFLDLASAASLTFEHPDLEKFPTIQMAYDVLELGGGAPAALNGANEELVYKFLNEDIRFTDIFKALKSIVKDLKKVHGGQETNDFSYLLDPQNIEEAIRSDLWGREAAIEYVSEKC